MTVTAMELVSAAKQQIVEVSAAEVMPHVGNTLLLDVREPAEFSAGHLPHAINIPRGLLEFQIGSHPVFQGQQSAEIIVYCQSGGRSALATLVLKQMGYSQAVSMAGGFKAWADNGFAVDRS